MSPPTHGRQPSGHTARAIVPRPRRVEIWDQVSIAFESKIPKGKWCTKEELVKASAGKHGMTFSVDELTEVIRGLKQKTKLGVNSKKVDGEWQYRFTKPSATETAASKLPQASPAKSLPGRPPAKKMVSARPMEANGLKPTLSKARAKGTPKRNAPLRPRAKSPRSASKSPAARSSASRKRGPGKMAAIDETRPRSGSAKKKPRVRPALGPTAAAVAAKKVPAGTEEGDRSGGSGGTVNLGAPDGEEGGSGWSCAIM